MRATAKAAACFSACRGWFEELAETDEDPIEKADSTPLCAGEQASCSVSDPPIAVASKRRKINKRFVPSQAPFGGSVGPADLPSPTVLGSDSEEIIEVDMQKDESDLTAVAGRSTKKNEHANNGIRARRRTMRLGPPAPATRSTLPRSVAKISVNGTLEDRRNEATYRRKKAELEDLDWDADKARRLVYPLVSEDACARPRSRPCARRST